MAETVMRWLDMLRLIPRDPQRIDAHTLRAKLAEIGHNISLRSLQRDLSEASRRFPLMADEEEKPYGWYFPKNYLWELPGMDPSVALAFSVLNQHASHLLPTSVLDHLSPWFGQAEAVLDSHSSRLRQWRDHLRVVPDWMPRLSPILQPGVFDAIQNALLQGKKLEGEYQGRRDDEPKSLTINPLGLVSRQKIYYLVCTLWNYENPVQLALHRFAKAEVLEEVATDITGFDLDDYVDSGAFGVLRGPPIRIKLRFQIRAGMHLLEAPISIDQEVEDDGGDHFILTATVPDNAMLRWWIASFEDRVEWIE